MSLAEVALVDDESMNHDSLGSYLEIFGIARIAEHAYTFDEAIALADALSKKAKPPLAIIIDGDLRSGIEQRDGEIIAQYMRRIGLCSTLIGHSSGEEFSCVDYFVDKNRGGAKEIGQILMSL